MSWIVKPSYVDPGGGCNGYCKAFCGARVCVNNCSKNLCVLAVAAAARRQSGSSGFVIKQNRRPMSASAIKLSKVSKRYGKRRVLHDVSFEVNQSELCALVGANGAGKSTLIKIVLGLCEPSSGSVELFGGKSKKELSLMRTRVGYVPDSSGAYQSLSAVENLRIRCAEWGLDETREVPRVLGLVGLDVDEKKSVSSFSLGMKRRLDIATALLGDTDVLIFDEPANGLDPLGIESIWALIGRLNREQGKTMLISSHDLDELASVATSCVFIHDGELLKKESMAVIRDEASSLKEYYRRLMNAVSL